MAAYDPMTAQGESGRGECVTRRMCPCPCNDQGHFPQDHCCRVLVTSIRLPARRQHPLTTQPRPADSTELNSAGHRFLLAERTMSNEPHPRVPTSANSESMSDAKQNE